MNVMQLIQEAGWPAYLAIALGGLGLSLGFFALTALMSKSASAFTLGVATLLVGAAAAGAGIGGTFWGRHQVERAVGYVGSGLDKERIMRQGFREARSSSWVGLFAALLPLALGGAAAFGGARLKRAPTRAQHLGDPMVSTDEASGQTVVAGVFVAIGALACGGAWAVAHSKLPELRFPFADEDSEAWQLAGALEDPPGVSACEALNSAISRFWLPTDASAWPRKLSRPIPPELAAWRERADLCANVQVAALEAGSGSREQVLQSALLWDEALHARVVALGEKPAEADDDSSPGFKEALLKTMRTGQQAIRVCYERELIRAPSLEGKLTVELIIGANGDVSSIKDVSAEPFPSVNVSQCVLGAVRKLKFPHPAGGAPVTVRYPFVFKAG